MTSAKLEIHGTLSPASYHSVEDRIEEKWYQRLQDQLKEQQERGLQLQREQQERNLQLQKEQQEKHDAQRAELYKTIVKQARRNTALAVKFPLSLFVFSF